MPAGAHFLPLAINSEHFERALPQIEAAIAGIAGREFSPESSAQKKANAVQTLTSMLPGYFRGESNASPQGYANIHHLMISLAQAYPEMIEIADKKIERYLSHPVHRTKLVIPGDADIISLCSISNYEWKDLCEKYCLEMEIRLARWYVERFGVNYIRDRRGAWDEMFMETLSFRKQLMSQVMFLNEVARPKTAEGRRETQDTTLLRYNESLGALDPNVRRAMSEQLKAITACSSLQDYLRIMEHPQHMRSAKFETKVFELLEKAVQRQILLQQVSSQYSQRTVRPVRFPIQNPQYNQNRAPFPHHFNNQFPRRDC